MFEHRKQPLLARRQFIGRMARAFLATLALVGMSLLGGTLGVVYFHQMSWSEAFHRACLVLGQHDVDHVADSAGARVFAGVFVLYARLLFVSLTAILVAPAIHRMLHNLHLAETKDGER